MRVVAANPVTEASASGLAKLAEPIEVAGNLGVGALLGLDGGDLLGRLSLCQGMLLGARPPVAFGAPRGPLASDTQSVCEAV